MENKNRLLNARENLAKKVNGMYKISNPEYAGAYILNGKQQICGGYFGAVYEDIYDGLTPAVDNGKNHPDMERLIDYNVSGHYSHISFGFIPNLPIINSDLKSRISTKDKCRDGKYYIKFGDTYINQKCFLLVAKTFKNPVVTVYDKPIYPILITGDNGKGMICPVRPSEELISKNIYTVKGGIK